VLSFLGFDRLSEYIENHLWLSNDEDYKDDEFMTSDEERADYYDYQRYH
jgi:hypothetical protein